MNDDLTADILATIIKIICFAAIGFTLSGKWRRAKRVGQNPLAAAWPDALMIVALIVVQMVIWLHGLRKPVGWVSLSLAGLLVVIAGIGLLRQTWHLDRKA